ncbi:MAG: DNA polymerase III subunit chi [Steroidobacteraceae bacterium]
MSQVDFYVTDTVADDARLQLACKVTEKAYLAGLRVLVWCQAADELARFDELLWTFADRSFVPHEALAAGDAASAAPVVLTAGIEPADLPDVLVNLDADIPAIALRAPRVLEFIDGEPARRLAGRDRFRRYREQGLEPNTHRIGSL